MSSQVSVSEMGEVVIVIPEALRGAQGPSVKEEEEADLLISTQLTSEQSEEMQTEAPEEVQEEAQEEVPEEAQEEAQEELLDVTTPDESFTKEAIIVKLTEETDAADVFYSITCGDAKATLVWRKFVCPGINVKCVQFNSQLISPKEFVCLAGKSTLKDWKRAIRLNGTMLRKIMDSGELDFYQHSKVCSNTCRSTKIDLVGTKVSLSSDGTSELPSTPAADLNGLALSLSESTDEASEWVTAIGEDSVTFWKAVKEAGLLDEVVQDFETELQDVLKGLEERAGDPPLQVKDAVLLNNIVQNFGMLDLVKKVLASHKSQMDRYREQYSRSLAALEQQCDEHRQRAKELKSRSQHLNNVLMTLTPVPCPAPAKRPRLTRAVSGPAAVGTMGTVSTVGTVGTMGTLPLGQVLTVSGPQGGSYTLLASPLNPELTDTSGLPSGLTSGLTVLPEGLVKVLGPQIQLLTLPTGATLQQGALQEAALQQGELQEATLQQGELQEAAFQQGALQEATGLCEAVGNEDLPQGALDPDGPTEEAPAEGQDLTSD